MDMPGRIKLIRGSKSQDAFAQEVGVSKMTVGRWERRERTPDADDLNGILKAYPDVHPMWLLTGEGEMRRTGVEVKDDIWEGDLTFREELQYAVTLAIVELAAPGIDEQTAKNHASVCTEVMQLLEKGREAVPPIAYVRKIVKLITSLYDFWDSEDENYGKNDETSNKEVGLEYKRVIELVEKIASRGKSKALTKEEERIKILEMVEEAKENGGMIKLPTSKNSTT